MISTTLTSNDDFHQPCEPLNPNFNCSRKDYLEFVQGPQQLPHHLTLIVTFIYGFIFLTGVLGNILVCVVIVRHSSMHTATNYYLFNLSVADILYLILGLPTEVIIYWHQYPYLFGSYFCKIRAFLSETSTYVSVLTIVAFSMERFLAICHPLYMHTMIGFRRALRIIIIIWIIAILNAIPFGVVSGINYETYPLDNSTMLESAFCGVTVIPENLPIFEISFCVFFLIPMILIAIVYTQMAHQIRVTTNEHLAVVVVTFFICWLPFHIQRLWISFARNYEFYEEINEWLFSITGFAYYISCTINPIIYNMMSLRYRLAFRYLLCGENVSSDSSNALNRNSSTIRNTYKNNINMVVMVKQHT